MYTQVKYVHTCTDYTIIFSTFDLFQRPYTGFIQYSIVNVIVCSRNAHGVMLITEAQGTSQL